MSDSSWWWRRRPLREDDTAPPTGPTPAGPRGERTKTVAVRLTPAEYAVWVETAAADGRGQMGRWVRETVTDHLAGRTGSRQRQVEGVPELRADLSHVGSNLNQIARALNIARRGVAPTPDIRLVMQAIEATRAELSRVRDRLEGL